MACGSTDQTASRRVANHLAVDDLRALVTVSPDATGLVVDGRSAEFARRWFPEFEHEEVNEIHADGVGEQRWAVQGCQSDPAAAAGGWATASTRPRAPPPTD